MKQLGSRRVRRRIATLALLQLFNIAYANGSLPPFMVKGGRALEFRFGALARSSRDVDVVLNGDSRVHSFLLEVNCDYNGTDWSRFELEIVAGEVTEWDVIQAPDLQRLGLEMIFGIPCMTIAEQIAQKLHAVSDPGTDRARDLYDIYLLQKHCTVGNSELLQRCVAEFERRNTHGWPPSIELRGGWRQTLTELLENDKISRSVEEIMTEMRQFLLRLHGVQMAQNYQYRFLVLSGLDHIPTPVEIPLARDTVFEAFVRMTEQEGWRLTHMVPYPSREQTRAMLAILEKPLEDRPD